MDFSLGIDALQMVGISFEKTAIELRLSNFEAAFIALVKKQADAPQAAGDTLDPATALAELTGLARERLPSFLSSGPGIEVTRLEVATREGRFSATMKLTVLLRQIIVQSMTTKVQAQGGQLTVNGIPLGGRGRTGKRNSAAYPPARSW